MQFSDKLHENRIKFVLRKTVTHSFKSLVIFCFAVLFVFNNTTWPPNSKIVTKCLPINSKMITKHKSITQLSILEKILKHMSVPICPLILLLAATYLLYLRRASIFCIFSQLWWTPHYHSGPQDNICKMPGMKYLLNVDFLSSFFIPSAQNNYNCQMVLGQEDSPPNTRPLSSLSAHDFSQFPLEVVPLCF